jgi:chaperonin GroEL
MLNQVATISTNNDPELGKIIGDAFRLVDLTGVVVMEPTEDNETSVELWLWNLLKTMKLL